MVQVVKEFAENEPDTFCMDGKCIDPQSIKYSLKLSWYNFPVTNQPDYYIWDLFNYYFLWYLGYDLVV